MYKDKKNELLSHTCMFLIVCECFCDENDLKN